MHARTQRAGDDHKSRESPVLICSAPMRPATTPRPAPARLEPPLGLWASGCTALARILRAPVTLHHLRHRRRSISRSPCTQPHQIRARKACWLHHRRQRRLPLPFVHACCSLQALQRRPTTHEAVDGGGGGAGGGGGESGGERLWLAMDAPWGEPGTCGRSRRRASGLRPCHRARSGTQRGHEDKWSALRTTQPRDVARLRTQRSRQRASMWSRQALPPTLPPRTRGQRRR